MRLDNGNFFGEIAKQSILEYFNLTLTIYNPQCKIPKHHHQNPYLSLLIDGSYKENSKDDVQIVTKGNTIFRPADYDHTNEFNEFYGKCFNVEIKPDALYLFKEYNNNHKVIFVNHSSLELYILFYDFYRTSHDNSLNNLALEVCSHLFYQESSKEYGRADWVKEVINMIQDNPGHDFKVEEIANTIHVHPIYLVRKFKEKTGFKLSQFIRKVRLQKAVHQLATGTNSFSQISYNCGFYDQSHFIKVFRSYFGVAPNHFIKAIKG